MTTWVLLRGLTRESAHWGDFTPALGDALGPQHRVSTLDLPGTGVLHGVRSPASVPGMVEACRAELRRHAGAEPVVLVAMSLGAMVAVEWAATAPGELAGCVLINTSLRGFSPFWRRLQPHNYATLARLMLAGATPLQREQAILAMTSRFVERHRQRPRAWAAIAQQRPVSRGNALRQLAAAARYRAPRTAPAVHALVLASAGDRLVSPQCSQRLAAAWGWPLAMQPDAGHDLPLDAPGWVAAQIAGWWAAVTQLPPNCHRPVTP